VYGADREKIGTIQRVMIDKLSGKVSYAVLWGTLRMPEISLWDELTRSEQRLLIRLFGGGSLRNQTPADVESLCRRGLVDDEQKLSVPRLLVLTLAMRRQQADALRRAGVVGVAGHAFLRSRYGVQLDT
jgi:hypothetical protein